MGNCTGVCVSTNEDDRQKVTSDQVKTALSEKENLYREQNSYNEQQSNQEGKQMRKLEQRGGGANGQRESKGPVELANKAIYTGEWLNSMKDGYG